MSRGKWIVSVQRLVKQVALFAKRFQIWITLCCFVSHLCAINGIMSPFYFDFLYWYNKISYSGIDRLQFAQSVKIWRTCATGSCAVCTPTRTTSCQLYTYSSTVYCRNRIPYCTVHAGSRFSFPTFLSAEDFWLCVEGTFSQARLGLDKYSITRRFIAGPTCLTYWVLWSIFSTDHGEDHSP